MNSLERLESDLKPPVLNMKEQAHAIKYFKDAGWTEHQVARKFNVSRSWVQIRFMLVELPDEVQDAAAAGLLNQKQIRNCYSLRENPDAVLEVLKNIKLKRLGARR